KAIDLYYTRFTNNESNIVFTDGSIELEAVEIIDPIHIEAGIPQLNWGNDLKIYFRFKLNKEIGLPLFTFHLLDKEQRPVASFERSNKTANIVIQNGGIEFTIVHKNLQLSKGIYSINLALGKNGTREPIYRKNDIITFQVSHEEDSWAPFLLNAEFLNL